MTVHTPWPGLIEAYRERLAIGPDWKTVTLLEGGTPLARLEPRQGADRDAGRLGEPREGQGAGHAQVAQAGADGRQRGLDIGHDPSVAHLAETARNLAREDRHPHAGDMQTSEGGR